MQPGYNVSLHDGVFRTQPDEQYGGKYIQFGYYNDECADHYNFQIENNKEAPLTVALLPFQCPTFLLSITTGCKFLPRTASLAPARINSNRATSELGFLTGSSCAIGRKYICL